MFVLFQSDDIVPNQQETVTRAMFSGNDGNLTTYFTSSAQTVSQKAYYYEVFNSASTDPGAESQFSVAYGHRGGSGSLSEGGQVGDTAARGIYTQYKQLCLNAGTNAFTIDGANPDYIYTIKFTRARMKDGLNPGSIELNLHHLSGSEFIEGGGSNNEHTGSNVEVGAAAAIRLIDDSKTTAATLTEAGEVYNLVSGSIEDGVYNSIRPHKYGLVYPRHGIVVISGPKLDMSASFGTVTGSDVAGDNAYKFFHSLASSANFLIDASGDVLGTLARSEELVKSTHYFVRARAAQFNYSNNPTFVTGSDGDLAVSDFETNPQVYITTVGLYDENKNLLAVAKSSKPIPKTFRKEALIEVKLDY